MRAFVTGATGFIGGRLAGRLRERGDEVVALVRDPSKASDLKDSGVELVHGDLDDTVALEQGMTGADAVFHVAALYKVGVPKREHQRLFDVNVTGTENVIDAAVNQKVPRIVYVSTIGAFGNTNKKVVDESYKRRPADYLSAYDETKYLAHELVEERAQQGAPIVTVQPGAVYGPGDHSEIATQIENLRKRKMPALAAADTGFNFVHVDDVVQGILLAHEKGKPGESYVLGGQLGTIRDLVTTVAAIENVPVPKITIPGPVMKMGIPFAPLITRMMGLPPNLRELIRASDKVTYWAKDDKAREELGYSPRDLETGMKETLAATR